MVGDAIFLKSYSFFRRFFFLNVDQTIFKVLIKFDTISPLFYISVFWP